ncbi:unnamed protein product [Phytophthora fragariaefolia]|uniref:Unnamed protein product n=1 Tax=Phytophthora fragariaefolia TaxID=1490495 RepID=A0A9W7D560_9STRA|nr:unnamed protein product [Phytophthora fragariaefolia]
MVVDALIVEGASTEFLLGEDWMLDKGVKIDFVACEMKWYEEGVKMVVHFQCSEKRNDGVAKARVVRRARVRNGTHHNVELAVSAPDGTEGLFLPDRRIERHMLLAPTLTTVRDGKVTSPSMNLEGKTTELPSRDVLNSASIFRFLALSSFPPFAGWFCRLGDMDGAALLCYSLRIN